MTAFTPATIQPVTETNRHGTRRTYIKICGITRYEDARCALNAGADALGFIFAESRRCITAAAASKIVRSLPQQGNYVGVFMNQKPAFIQDVLAEVPLTHIQLHGDEDVSRFCGLNKPIIKRIAVQADDSSNDLAERIHAVEHATPLIDPGCGDGTSFDYSLLSNVQRPFLLAGGLTAENITVALTTAQPIGVDVCTGVEARPGIKDRDRLKAFINTIRSHDARH